jgi:predicted permease
MRHTESPSGKPDRDAEDEFAFHIEMATRDLIARGWAPRDAAREAQRRFGDVDRVRRACAIATREPLMRRVFEWMRHDVAFSVRMMARHPAHALFSVTILAVGIGATSATISAVDGVLVRALPYTAADRIVALSAEQFTSAVTGRTFRTVEWETFNENATTIEAIGGTFAVDLTTRDLDGNARRIEAAMVTPGFLSVFGAIPLVGSVEIAAIDGRDPGVILTHGFWQRHLGGDTTALGRTIVFDRSTFTVAGILGPRFRPVEGNPEVYIPHSVGTRGWIGRWLGLYARMTPAASPAAVHDELSALMAAAGESEERSAGWSANATLLHQRVAGGVRPALLALSASVALVLFIAVANVTGLAVVHAASRRREIAVRMALGAGFRRMVAQGMTESLLLALIGGTIGVLIGGLALEVLLRLAPPELPRIEEIQLNARVLSIALILSMLSACVLGPLPALIGRSSPLAVGHHSRGGGHGPGHHRLLSAIVAAEVAVSIVLVVCAGLVVKSLRQLSQVEPGFETAGTLAVQVALPSSSYPAARRTAFFTQLVTEVEGVPGVRAAGIGSHLPLTGRGAWLSATTAQRLASGLEAVDGLQRVAHADYFETLRIRLVDGRLFDAEDGREARRVVVINQRMANVLWPNARAVGQRVAFRSEPQEGDWIEVIGVVTDVRYQGLAEPAEPQVYEPHPQQAWNEMFLFVRSDVEPSRLVPTIRAIVAGIDRDVPVADAMSLTALRRAAAAEPRFNALLFSILGAIALFMAVAGIYGVLSFVVSQRSREISIRMALGARRVAVLRGVLTRALFLLGLGALVGFGATIAITRVMRALLFETSPTDATTFATSGLVLTVSVLLVSLLPAYRASRMHPMQILRDD